MVKRRAGATYVFAVVVRGSGGPADITVQGLPAGASVEVLGENRSLKVGNGRFADTFDPCGVHLYRVAAAPGAGAAQRSDGKNP
jgi:hypothetical protein